MQPFRIDRSAAEGADLDQLDDAHDTPGLLSAIAALAENGAISTAEVAGAEAQWLAYPADDEEAAGFLLAVRPVASVPWLAAGLQLSSTWQATADLFDVVEYAAAPTSAQVLAAVGQLVDQANAMLPLLGRLAGVEVPPVGQCGECGEPAPNIADHECPDAEPPDELVRFCAEPECNRLFVVATEDDAERFCEECRELVPAVRVNLDSDEHHHVPTDAIDGAQLALGQCGSCGGSTFCVERIPTASGSRIARVRCSEADVDRWVDGCGTAYPVVEMAARLVTF